MPSVLQASRPYAGGVVSPSKQRIADQRREKLDAIRRQQRRRDRTRRILLFGGLGLGVAIVLAVVVGVLVTPSRTGSPPSSAGSVGGQIVPAAVAGATTVQSAVTAVPDTSGIPGVLAWDTTGWPGDGGDHAGALEHQHVPGPVTYGITPPVGGPHNAIWMNAGVYTKPVPTERAVHNMEHGAVWITYDPQLPAADVAKLTAFVARQSLIAETGETAAGAPTSNSNRYVDLSPWATSTLPAPIVISAWGHQLRVTSAPVAEVRRRVPPQLGLLTGIRCRGRWHPDPDRRPTRLLWEQPGESAGVRGLARREC